MASRTISWSALVAQADKNHQQKSTNPVEYEFSAPGRGPEVKPNDHENGMRVFHAGNYQTRGAYSS